MNSYKPISKYLFPLRWWSTFIENLSGQEALASTLDVYKGIIEDGRIGYITRGETMHPCVNDTLVSDLMEIERFMRYTLFGPVDTALKNPRGDLYRDGPEQRYRMHFFRRFFHWTWLDVSSFHVSPLVRLFFGTLEDLRLRELDYMPWDVPLSWTHNPILVRLDNLYNGRLRNHSDLYDLFVQQVREAVKERAGEAFRRNSTRRILLALRHYHASLNFVQRLLEQVPKMWISRLEFGYDQSLHPKPDAPTAFAHLRCLIETELDGVNGAAHLGHLWHADYSATGGYNFQVFWFDRTDPKSKKGGGESIVQRLARRWNQEITLGGGYTLDCAESPSPYKHQYEHELSGRRSLPSSSLNWTLLYLFRKPLYYMVKGVYSHGINSLPTLPKQADDDLAPVLRQAADAGNEPFRKAPSVLPAD